MRSIFWALCCATFLWGFSCPASAAGTKEIVIAIRSTPPHFNPALSSGGTVATVGIQLYAGLTRVDVAGSAMSYLVKSWKASSDGHSVHFELRENALSHDGHPITSGDVAYSILMSHEHHSFRPMLKSVTRVGTLSLHTVIVWSSRPFPLLPKVFVPALILILPRHASDNGHPLSIHPVSKRAVGSGPFMPKPFIPDRSVRLVRDPCFFLPDRPIADGLTFRIFWDRGEVPPAFASGEMGAYLFASCIQSRRFLNDYKFAPFTVLPLGNLHPYTVLSYNLHQRPFSDRKVRRTFVFATDRNSLVDYLLHGTVKPLSNSFPPGALFYTPLPVPHDIAETNRLFGGTGYPCGKDGKRFPIIMDYSPNSPLPRELLRLLQYRLAARLGIEVRIYDSESVSGWMRHVATGDYQVVLDELFVWYDPVIEIHRLYSKNNSDRGVARTNSGGYVNDMVRAPIQQATEKAISHRRQTLYDRLQCELVKNNILLWSTIGPYILVMQPSLCHLEQLGFGFMSPLDGIKKVPSLFLGENP